MKIEIDLRELEPKDKYSLLQYLARRERYKNDRRKNKRKKEVKEKHKEKSFYSEMSDIANEECLKYPIGQQNEVYNKTLDRLLSRGLK